MLQSTDAVGERGAEDLRDRLGKDERQLLPRLGRELLEIGAVLSRENDRVQPGPLRGQDLVCLLYTSDAADEL